MFFSWLCLSFLQFTQNHTTTSQQLGDTKHNREVANAKVRLRFIGAISNADPFFDAGTVIAYKSYEARKYQKEKTPTL